MRLSPAAGRAIDERAARLGNVTRSAMVERAIERFVTQTLARDPRFITRPVGRETKLRKFKISAAAYTLLRQAQHLYGHGRQEMLRHALGDLTGAY